MGTGLVMAASKLMVYLVAWASAKLRKKLYNIIHTRPLTQFLSGNTFKITEMLQYMEGFEECSLSIIILPQT